MPLSSVYPLQAINPFVIFYLEFCFALLKIQMVKMKFLLVVDLWLEFSVQIYCVMSTLYDSSIVASLPPPENADL